MGVHSFEELKEHIGHDIQCVCYGKSKKDCWNVAIECHTCHIVIIDFDSPDVDNE